MTIQPLLPWPVLGIVAAGALGLTLVRLRGNEARLAPALRSLAMIALVLGIALDPAIDGDAGGAIRSEANVMFVVDTTGSMAAEDFDGDRPRLEGVRTDIMELVDEFPGAHFMLITFDSKSPNRDAMDHRRRCSRHRREPAAPGADDVRPRLTGRPPRVHR